MGIEKNLEVLILLWNFNMGGVQKISVEMANHLSSQGHRVRIASSDREGGLLARVAPEVDIIELPIQATNNPWAWINQLFRLKRSIPKGTLIVTNGPNNFRQLGRVNTLLKRWKLLHILHNDLPIGDKIKSRLGHREIRFLLQSNRAFLVALSQKQRDEHQRFYQPKNLQVIPNFTDVNHGFLKKKSEKASFKGVSLGRYSDQKGYDILLKAMAEVEDSIQVHVFGIGEDERRKLEKDRLKSGISNIEFKPAVKEIYETLIEYDFFVLSSRYEPFGLVLVEAFSCGLPVVATDCDGPRELIETSNGLLVEKENHLALAEGINKMVSKLKSGMFDPMEVRSSAQLLEISEVVSRYLNFVNAKSVKA